MLKAVEAPFNSDYDEIVVTISFWIILQEQRGKSGRGRNRYCSSVAGYKQINLVNITK